MSVFLVDTKYALYGLLERPLLWAVRQYPSTTAAAIARRYRIEDTRL